MSKTQTSINTNSKSAMAFFESNAVKRSRASKSSEGGRYNCKTRRLVIPASFAGESVAVAVADGIVVVAKGGSFKVHPTQHFVTLPDGTVDSKDSVTLEKTDLPEAVKDLGDDAVAYKLPKASKTTKAKASKTTKAKA